MGKVWKIMAVIMLFVTIGLHPQYAEVCQAETAAKKNAESDYTFDAQTGTLTFYGRGMLGCREGLLYEDDDYQSYFSHYDTERFGVSLEQIRKVVIGDEITGIYESFFQSMKGIEEVEIGAQVAEIQDFAFMHCPSIRQITLSPANPYFKIVDRGLYSADGTTLYLYPPACDEQYPVIAPGTRTVCSGAFAYSRLKKITIPAAVTALSDGMFRDCTQLETVSFAKGSKCKKTMLSGTAGGTFEGCQGLKKIVFGEKFQWIAGNTFKGCTSLKSIYLGKAFRGFWLSYRYYTKAFSGSEDYGRQIFLALEKIRISKQNKVYQTKNNVVFSKDGKTLYYYPLAKKGKSYKVPDSVRKIEDRAFYENQYLQSVYIGKNTVTVGYDAFCSSQKLSRVVFGKKIRTLEEGAFSSCSKLKDVKNLDRVKNLCRFALAGTQVYLITWDIRDETEGMPGKDMTLYLPLSYRGKDVRWSVVSGKKHVRIMKRYADGNRVKLRVEQSGTPPKPGKLSKSKIQAKVGKKKFICVIYCYAEE